MSQEKGRISLVIIIILVIIGIIVGICLFGKQDTEETNTIGTVEKEMNTNNDKETNTNNDEEAAFLFPIEDVFSITGRGTVVTGKVQRGKIKVGDKVQIIGLDKEVLTTEVTSIEMVRKEMNQAVTGDNVGLLLKDIDREQVQRGQVIAKPNSITAAKKFDADIYVLTKEEGGSSTTFVDGISTQIYVGPAEVSGTIDLHNNIEKVEPGDNASCTVTLETSVAMVVGTEITLRVNGTAYVRGTVTKVY